uniref:MD-2-related lipid-recognition domain-containing protein n=2 Tax=Noccaea caerulescens TaxID=107243 RepID=A0A1J3IP25_NOCCA
MAISHFQPLLLLLLVSLFVLPALSARFGNCRSFKEYPVNVAAVGVSPYPVKRSTNGNITITGNTSKDIPDGATVNLELYTFVLVSKKIHPLCDVTKCPVKTGPFVITLSNVFTPKEIKSGGYAVTVSITEEDVRAPMMCVVFACKIKGGYTSLLSQVTE